MQEEYVKPWTASKSRDIVCCLAEIIDELKKIPETDVIFMKLAPTLYDATKIMAQFNGAEWEPKDRDLVFEKGFYGYEELLVKYGLINESQRTSARARFESAISQIRGLLKGDPAPNRTMINEIVNRLDPTDAWVILMSQLTDKVNMGDLDWQTYCQRGNILLDHWLSSFSQES